jgi:spore coat protein U-like protein
MKKNKVILGFLTSLVVSSSLAQTATGNLLAIAEVDQVCHLTNQDMIFGFYDANSADDLIQFSNVNLTCSNGTAYDLTIDIPAGDSATEFHMSNTTTPNYAGKLNYLLEWDHWLTHEYLSSLHIRSYSNFNGLTTTDSYLIKGKIPAGQYRAPGHYLENVVIRVAY